MTAQEPTPINFEKSLEELEALVEEMEKGELSLEDSLKRFERGIELARGCQTVLQAAEQKVEQLIERDGKTETGPFELQG